jgi:hypothetical protein
MRSGTRLFRATMLTFEVVAPRTIYQDLVATRRVLYLDHNVWIDLADGTTAGARETLELATLAVNAGLLVCPVSYPAMTELLKQGKTRSSIRQAHVMDALCSGVSMRAERHIIDLEVGFAHAFMSDGEKTATRTDMFTAVGCYLADGTLEFPDGWDVAGATEMTEVIRRNLPSVTWMLEHLPVDDFRRRHTEGDKRYVALVGELNADLADFKDRRGKLKADALRLEEHTYVLKTYILPRLPRIVGLAGMITGLGKLQKRQLKPGPSTLARIVEAMPSTNLSCELHVQRRLAGRSARPQDLYDQEHAVLGVPYSDAFGSSDGELLDLLRKARARERYGTRLLRGLAEIRTFVSDLLDSVTVRA